MQVRGSAARTAILSAARAALTEAGPAVPSMEAIAADAGVTRATVYNHFASRAVLIDEVLAAAVSEHRMDRLVEDSHDLTWPDALAGAVSTCARFWESERTLLRRLYADPGDAAVADRLRQREAWRSSQFERILAPLVTGETSAQIVGSIVAMTSFATYDQLVSQTGSHATAERSLLVASSAIAQSYAR